MLKRSEAAVEILALTLFFATICLIWSVCP